MYCADVCMPQVRRPENAYPSWYVCPPAGNVVSIDAAASGSLCGFQADHLFPWSRGGLTVPDNLGALHWCVGRRAGGAGLAGWLCMRALAWNWASKGVRQRCSLRRLCDRL